MNKIDLYLFVKCKVNRIMWIPGRWRNSQVWKLWLLIWYPSEEVRSRSQHSIDSVLWKVIIIKQWSTALTVTVYILWWSSLSLEPEHKEYIAMIQKPPTLQIHIKKIHKRNPWLLIFSPGKYANVTQNKKEVPLIVINDANHKAGKKKSTVF